MCVLVTTFNFPSSWAATLCLQMLTSWCVLYFHVSKLWFGCQCFRFLMCSHMLMHATAHRGFMNSARKSALTQSMSCYTQHPLYSSSQYYVSYFLSLARTRHTRTETCCIHVLLHTTHTKAATNIMTDHPQHCLWPTGRSTLTNAGCVHVWLQHTLYTTAASIAADHPQHSLASRQGHID